MGGVAWTEEEDRLLRECIQRYGEGKWHRIPLLAGLNRCRKSCRLRWFNYLRPNIKRGSFTNDEVENIIKLHKVYGNRWSLIASKLPGRTANDVKNYWNCHLSKRLNSSHYTEQNEEITHNVVHDNNNQCGSYEYKQHRPEIIKINNISGQQYPIIEPGANTQASKDSTLSKDIVNYVRDELYNDQTSPKQEYVKYPCDEEDGIMEVELGKDEIDFGLEEIQITMGEQSKCKWDFDELTFDLELWTNSL